MAVSNDTFERLPESLLSDIVSSLLFKEAVRTSILSRNWMNIYKSTRNIEFNELFFVKFDQSFEVVDAKRMAFSAFTKRWIENYRGNVIDKFALTISVPEIFSSLIDRCIVFAIQNKVKALELDYTIPSWIKDINHRIHMARVEMPKHVYGYSGLESLKLYLCDFVGSECVNFHSLKEVSLGYMRITLSNIKALLTNCEKLESLSFLKCWSSDVDFILKEEYLGLKKLVIDKCHFKFTNFRFNVPNLKIFNYHRMLTLFLFDIQSSALNEVNLDFSPEYGSQGHGAYLYKFLKNFTSVEVMTVCNYLLQVIYTGGRPIRMYRSMQVKHLILKTALHQFEFMGISFMLTSCPYLERLTIEIVEGKYLFGYEPMFNIMPESYWIESAKVYKCMKKCLKEIEIKGFKGTKNEFNVIRFFLVKGKALRKMSINLLKDDVEGEDAPNVAARREIAERFRMIPEASINVEISIY